MSFAHIPLETRARLAREQWADPMNRAAMCAALSRGWRNGTNFIRADDDMLAVIHECNDNATGMDRTAARLGIARGTLHRLLRDHGIQWKKSRRSTC
jgi:transcriptional regulator of acetoin/glycerol metabolism